MSRADHAPRIAGCPLCPLTADREKRELSADGVRYVLSFRREREIDAGDLLYRQGDPCEGIYCILDGLLGERRVDAEGHSTLIRLDHPGATLGYDELVTEASHRNSAEALRKSHVCFLPKSVVRELLDRNPTLGERLVRQLMRNLAETEDNYVIAMNQGVRARLLHVLLALYERYGSYEEAEGHAVDLPLARQDLASLIGTAPESISRTIRDLQRDRLVRFDGRKAYLSNLDAIYSEVNDLG